jgi:hypothetical protein
MSLIVATSKLNENTNPINSEKPSSFTNFFRSPIVIKPNSEIAVESVKLDRSGNITIGNRDFFCHYWGTDPDSQPEDDEYAYLTSFSRTIRLKRGTYSLDSYISHIQDRLNAQYADPRIYNNSVVSLHTNASGLEQGLSMKFTDKGLATGNDEKDQLSAHPVFNIANPVDRENASKDLRIQPSNKFTWNESTGVFSRTGADGLVLQNASCVGQLTGRPFGLNDGLFDISVKNASDRPFAVGLSRPQIQWETHESEQITDPDEREIHNIDENTSRNEYEDLQILDHTADQTEASIAGSYELYDYVFMKDDDGNVTISHRVWDEEGVDENGKVSTQQEIAYWTSGGLHPSITTKLSYTQFNGSWDGIRFKAVGDEIELYFKQNGKTVYDKIISSTLSADVGKAFNPIGDTSYALYPMINLGTGSVTITQYESLYTGDDDSYKFPTYTAGATGGYTPGSDMFSNEAVYAYNALSPERIHFDPDRTLASDGLGSAAESADQSVWKWSRFDMEDEGVTTYTYAGTNTANSVDWKHILTLGPMEYDNNYYTLLPSQEWPNMATRLGFNDRVDIASTSGDGYVVGDDTLVITFTSPSELQKTSLSSFIRLPGLTHKSFNGGQSSVSKIVYQVPQFTNDGRQFGALYFSPGEKTYIALNNPTEIMLNSLQVQIVDSNERELNSLTGTTQVVFHIRKR